MCLQVLVDVCAQGQSHLIAGLWHSILCVICVPIAVQVVICVLHLQRTFVDEGWFSVLVATQQVLLWIKLVGVLCCAKLYGMEAHLLERDGHAVLV